MPTVLSLETLNSLASSLPTLQCVEVSVNELEADGVAYVAELTAHEREQRIEEPFTAFKKATKQEDNAGIRAYLVAACLCSGPDRQFMAADAEAIGKLAAVFNSMRGKQLESVRRLADKVTEINGLGDGESAEKN